MSNMFDSIFIAHSTSSTIELRFDDSSGESDGPAFDLTPGFRFVLYGVPKENSAEISKECHEGNYTNAIKVGEISGTLILGGEENDLTSDPGYTRGDYSVNLRYADDVLYDPAGPFPDSHLNTLYIHELSVEEPYRNNGIGSLVLQNLPQLIQRYLHIKPNVLACLPFGIPPPTEEASITVFERGNTGENLLNDLLGENKENAIESLTQRIDRLHAFYCRNGFKEVGNSGLLYKQIYVYVIYPYDSDDDFWHAQ